MQYALVTLALTASTFALPTKREVIGNTLDTVTGTAGGVVGTATGATSGLGLGKRQELVDPALKTVDETLGGVTSTLGKRQNDVLTPVVDTAGGVVGTATGVVGSTGLTEGLLKRQEGLTDSLPVVKDLKVDELTSGLPVVGRRQESTEGLVGGVTKDLGVDGLTSGLKGLPVVGKRGLDASNAVDDVAGTVGNLKVGETVGNTVSGLDLPTTVGSATDATQNLRADKTVDDLNVVKRGVVDETVGDLKAGETVNSATSTVGDLTGSVSKAVERDLGLDGVTGTATDVVGSVTGTAGNVLKRGTVGDNVGGITDKVNVGETVQGATGTVGSATDAVKGLNLKRDLDLGALVSSISSEQLDDILSKVDVDGLLEDLTDILSNVDISGILSSLTDDQLSTITDGLGLGSLL